MLVLVVAYAGFASPLVVLITFAGSLCCALSIGQFAGRLPSAGWAYTYNSRGLGPAAGFLTGWMMIFLFPLWGILFPGAYTLANLLPFISLGWLLIGAIAAGILRARRPATFQALGRAVAPNLDKQLEPD